MKRSEAITHIVNVLRVTGNHYCDDGRDEQDADRILKRLESIGMLPPESSRSRRTMMFDLQHTQYAHIWDEDDFFEEQKPENNSSNSLDELLSQMDNDKETQEILSKLVPDGVKLK